MFPGVSIGGGGGATISFEGCLAGPCPSCGGMGSIANGTYQFLGDALRMIASGGRSAAQINQLQSILREAQQQRPEPQSVVDRIETEAPEMGALAALINQYLVPKNAGEFWQFIGVLLTALPMLLMLFSQKQDLDEKQVNAIVEKTVASTLEKTRPAKALQTSVIPSQKAKKKVGRNESCPCRSGKKYKMCCINQAQPTSR
jgi:hypothetical protein